MISGCSQEQKLSAVDINDSTEILYEVKSGTNITAVANELEEYDKVDQLPKLEGKRMIIMMSPKQKSK